MDQNAASSQKEEDIFDSLMGNLGLKVDKCMRKRGTIDGHKVSVGIGLFFEGILLSAVIVGDKLVACRRSQSTGEIFFHLIRSDKRIEVPSVGREILTIPSFVGAYCIQTRVMSPGRDLCGEERRVIENRPVFSLVFSADDMPHAQQQCAIDSKLFTSLFGSEFVFSGGPVLLIGSQRGDIYFTNFLCSKRVEEKRNFLYIIYSLDQPVVGIHFIHFPKNKLSTDPMVLLEETDQHQHMEPGTPNAILFLGQRGKIVICYAGNSSQDPLGFVEFHVPPPIISSIFVPNKCLLYSSLQGMYRICFRQECVDACKEKLSLSGSTCPIKIPEVSFKFPEKVFDYDCGRYFLQSEAPNDGGGGGELQCPVISLGGEIASLSFRDYNDKDMSRVRSSAQVGQEKIKQCLQSIQRLSEKHDILMGEIQSLNSILGELKGVLDILCVMQVASTSDAQRNAHAHDCPFSCSLEISHKAVSSTVDEMYVNAELSFLKTRFKEPLGTGWYFIVTLHVGNLTSKSASIAGMSPGDSISLRMKMEAKEGEVLAGSMNCFIHYDPQHLKQYLPHHNGSLDSTAFKSVTLSCFRKEFDSLDFLKPAQLSTLRKESISTVHMKAVKSMLTSPSLGKDRLLPRPAAVDVFSHSICLSLPWECVLATVQASASLSREEPAQQISEWHKLLHILIPTKPDQTSTRVKSGVEVFTAHDGSIIGFKLNNDGDGIENILKLTVYASSRKSLAEAIGCLNKRLVRVSYLPTVGREAVCRRHMELEGVLQEVGCIQRQFSAAYHQRNRSCITLEAYSQALKSAQEKAFQLYCQLRQMDRV